MRFHGHVKGGVVVPDHPEQLPEGAQVSIEVIGEPATEPRDPENTDRPFQGILALAGKAEGLPPDAARNYKHYLYGMPKEE